MRNLRNYSGTVEQGITWVVVVGYGGEGLHLGGCPAWIGERGYRISVKSFGIFF